MQGLRFCGGGSLNVEGLLGAGFPSTLLFHVIDVEERWLLPAVGGSWWPGCGGGIVVWCFCVWRGQCPWEVASSICVLQLVWLLAVHMGKLVA